MKTKIYTLFFALLTGAVLQLNAQCTVAITTFTVNGLTISVGATGTGTAIVPVYGWDFGDASAPALSQTATYTYAAAGTYNVCAAYFDLLDTANCQATSCTTIVLTAVGVPETAQLLTNLNAFPSPFTSTATVSYTLSQNSEVEIEVFDVTGKLVTKLANGPQTAGTHTLNWEAPTLEAGVYFIRMKAGDAIITRRIIKQ